MEIIKCGTEAVLKTGLTEGTITAIEIKFSNITYQFTYFMNNEIKSLWVCENELIIQKVEKQKIGYK